MDEVEVLRSLLETYSPSGNEAAAVRKFLGAAKSLGFSGHVDRAGNGIARIGVGRPKVMFLGHIDTVEGELPVRLKGGRIAGRGACDAKGALAAALVAASRHAGPGEVLVVAAVGEERDSRGARHIIPRHRPDFLIVGEPSGWSGVTIGYKGNLALLVRFEGERTHLSSPAPTTVEGALAFLEENGVAGRTEVVDRSEAVEVDPRNVVVRALCTGIRRAGAQPTLLRKLGTSDMNLAVPAWDCPAAAYGPGDSHLDHTDGESLDVEEYRRSVGILDSAFTLLAAQPPPSGLVESPKLASPTPRGPGPRGTSPSRPRRAA